MRQCSVITVSATRWQCTTSHTQLWGREFPPPPSAFKPRPAPSPSLSSPPSPLPSLPPPPSSPVIPKPHLFIQIRFHLELAEHIHSVHLPVSTLTATGRSLQILVWQWGSSTLSRSPLTTNNTHTQTQLFCTNYGHRGDASKATFSAGATFTSLFSPNPHLQLSWDPLQPTPTLSTPSLLHFVTFLELKHRDTCEMAMFLLNVIHTKKEEQGNKDNLEKDRG